jgi:tape measure domain-containing protein
MAIFDVPSLIFRLGADATDFNRKMDDSVQKMMNTVDKWTGLASAFRLGAQTGQATKDLTQGVAQGLMKAGGMVVAFYGALDNKVSSIIASIASKAQSVFNRSPVRYGMDWASAVGGNIAQKFRDVASYGPAASLGPLYTGMIVPAAAIGMRVVSAFKAVAGPVQTVLTPIWNRAAAGFSTAVNSSFTQGLVSAARSAMPRVVSGLGAAGGWLGTKAYQGARGLGMGAMAAGRGAVGLAGGALGSMWDAATSVPAILGAGVAIAAVTAALVAGAKAAIEYAADFEKIGTAFEVMTGSAERGRGLMDEITQLSLGTPFKADELMGTAKQLKAFGVETSNLIPVLKALGNVSSGTGTDIGRIALAYGQVMTAGRLMGPELRQFTDAGVPLIENLAKVMDKPKQSIKGLVEQGEVSAGDVVAAFNRMNAAGGVFAGMMEKHAQTVAGRWATMQGSIQIALRNVGLSFFRGFDVGDLLKEWTAGIQAMAAEGGKLDGFFQKMRELFDIAVAVGQAMGSVAKDGVGALVSASSGLVPSWDEFKNTVKETLLTIASGIGQAIEDLKKFIATLIGAVKQVEQATAVTSSTNPFKGQNPDTQPGFYSRARAEGKSRARSIFDWAGSNLGDIFSGGKLSKAFVATGQLGPEASTSPIADALGKGLETLTRPGDPLYMRKKMEESFKGMEEAQKARQREKMSPLAELMGPFAAIAVETKGMAKAAGEIRRNLEVGSKATELFNYIQGEMLKGTDAYERFHRKMALIEESAFGPGGRAGMALAGFGAAPAAALAQMNPGQVAFARYTEFRELERELAHMLEVKLPQAVMQGSAEAQDVINRTNLKQPDRQDEVRKILEMSRQLHEQQVKLQEETVKALEKLYEKPVANKKKI